MQSLKYSDTNQNLEIIRVSGLNRHFKLKSKLTKKAEEFLAVQDLNFSIFKGEIFGLLGPNGAGKTTTIKILSTLLAPSNGEAKVFGLNTYGEEDRIRPNINFVFGGERSIYWRLTGLQNLQYFSDIYKVPQAIQKERIPALLKLVGITEEQAARKVETYSKGMKQKIQIAKALVNDPEVLFLDEPTIGLDPESARDFRKLIRDLKKKGKTILLTSHYMAEVEDLCDRIGIIDQGKLIALDNTQDLISKIATSKMFVQMTIAHENSNMLTYLEQNPQVKNFNRKDGEVFIKIDFEIETTEQLTSILSHVSSSKISDLQIRKATLEDAYLALVSRNKKNDPRN